MSERLPPRKIEIVCHKGANKQAPENTLAAARLCVDWGMDYLEVDVRTSRDGVFYLMHDETVDRTTNGSGEIGEMTSTEIDRLDAGSWFGAQFAGERVPRLEPLLRWIKGQARVFFDIKRADHRPLAALLHSLGMEDDCFFWSGSDEWMLELHRLYPQLALKVNVRNVAEVADAQALFGARIVEVRLGDMSEELVAACRERGLRIMLYEGASDPECFRQVVAWKPDLFNTDCGDLFARFLAERSV